MGSVPSKAKRVKPGGDGAPSKPAVG
jgi:hypothetical protein